MKRSKKIVLGVLLTVAVLAGSIGGIALANDNGEVDNPPAAHHGAMLDRVCEIYNEANPDATIDADALKAAFDTAREEMRANMPAPPAMDTEAMLARLQSMLDDGKITQEQYDELADWLNAMPDTSDTEAYQAWLESRPDIQMPFGPFGHGGHHGFGGPPCAPAEE